MEENKALEAHKKWAGKLETISKAEINSRSDLAIAYTPGVAEPCKVIACEPEKVYDYTIKNNTVAIVSDGTAVLGLGDIGPKAALPVMEGKACLFKRFAGLNAFPICIDSKDVDEIVRTVKLIAPNFGGINLEDISAPRCFEIEKRLKKELDIPVTHDDQHGTAIVVLSGIINALKVVDKKMEKCKVVINGAGSAGVAICKHLILAGFKNIILCDKDGIISSDYVGLNPVQEEMLKYTNLKNEKGLLKDALVDADIFIGVSKGNLVSEEMARSMAKDAIVFALANPTPEIMPELAKKAGVKVIATGRSDYPNQVNNVLAFPGMFKGALACRSQITSKMELAASYALASLVSKEELNENFIMPDPFDPRVCDAVANAVIDNK